MTRVLVTRPEPGATRTAQRLTSLGYDPIIWPLSTTIALHPEFKPRQFDIIVATSAQAFHLLADELVERLAALPTLVVGEATAAAAQGKGFTTVTMGGDDIEGLIAQVKGNITPHAKVLYLCGKVRRPDLEQALVIQRIDHVVLEIYDTHLVSYSADNWLELCASPIDAVLLTSLFSAEAMLEILRAQNMRQAFDNSIYICFSERIAAVVRRINHKHIMVCNAPNEEAMLDLLTHHFPT